MCGIAGQARGDGLAPSLELLQRMCARIEHRGPDSRGIHLDQGVGLGIQRLRVIDLVSGDQPMFNEDRSVAVVLNGEIYNHRELRRELERKGHRFRTHSDTEVIAHLYEERGADFVRSLLGMFAVAVWDSRRRLLVLARDRLGKKPLFYAERDGVLSFASEIQALLEDREIPRAIDCEALDVYLALGYVAAPRTAFSAIRKLPPAHRLLFRDSRSEIERYWRLDYAPKRELGDGRELCEELTARLRTAVRRRLLADVPVGAFLSGGIDSAAVVSAMAHESSTPVKTFSIGFESERINELPQARLLAERFGCEHHEFMVAPDAISLLPRIVRHHGEPFADATSIPTFHLAEVTRGHVTVALNGDGGDEIFGGYSRYVSNLALARLSRLPPPLRRAIQRAGAALAPDGDIESWRSRVRRLARTAAMDEADRYFAYMSDLTGLSRDGLYTDEFRAQIRPGAAREVIVGAWRASGAGGTLDRMLATDVATYLPDDLLAKVDIASMASSLEVRSPFLDHEMLEFAASLPQAAKVRGAEKKVLLRQALRGTIPDEILDAPKRGFRPPLADWLRGPLGGFASEVLLDRTARERGHFRAERVASLLQRHRSGAEDHSQGIWRLLMYELWHHEFVDGRPGVEQEPREPSHLAMLPGSD
jgi:asparagine synthase (glutamine-hydrolysing)